MAGEVQCHAALFDALAAQPAPWLRSSAAQSYPDVTEAQHIDKQASSRNCMQLHLACLQQITTGNQAAACQQHRSPVGTLQVQRWVVCNGVKASHQLG